jgi:LysM repeat protein
MTRRQWSVVIVLVLLNYIVFNILIRQLIATSRPVAVVTSTPRPTFTATVIRATPTPQPTNTLVVPPSTPTPPASPTIAVTPSPTASPVPTATPTGGTRIHRVQAGETLSEIAALYGVSVQALVRANGITNPSLIYTGQELIIPYPGEPLPTAAPRPTRRPTTPVPQPSATPVPTVPSFQFTGGVIWDPLVAPNCAGPSISKESVIRDTAGNPVNGARVEMNCYDNVWLSRPSGNPGEYDPGHYDFSVGQIQPQPWTCTVRVHDIHGVPVASSQVVTVQFDTNDCRPGGIGHQVAIVNWKKHW